MCLGPWILIESFDDPGKVLFPRTAMICKSVGQFTLDLLETGVHNGDIIAAHLESVYTVAIFQEGVQMSKFLALISGHGRIFRMVGHLVEHLSHSDISSRGSPIL